MWENDVVVEVLVSILVSKEETHFGLFSFQYGLRFGCFCTGKFEFIFSCALFETETHPLLFLFWIRGTLFGCSRLNRIDFLWAKKKQLASTVAILRTDYDHIDNFLSLVSGIFISLWPLAYISLKQNWDLWETLYVSSMFSSSLSSSNLQFYSCNFSVQNSTLGTYLILWFAPAHS